MIVVEQMTYCINWTGKTVETHGNVYGYLNGKQMILAHRWSYEKFIGPIPDRYVIDHLCRNGLCINPMHLEAVTNKENIMRGNGLPARNARKTECKNGHEFNKVNTRFTTRNRRVCIPCEREYNKNRR